MSFIVQARCGDESEGALWREVGSFEALTIEEAQQRYLDEFREDGIYEFDALRLLQEVV